MQCPNCKRIVRSKTQCVHCGEVFTKEDKIKSKRASARQEPTVPHTPHRRGGGLLSGVLRTFLAVFVVFLIFLFGPSLVKDFINSNEPPIHEVEEVVEMASDEFGSGELDLANLESQEETGQVGKVKLKEPTVNTEQYPQVQMELAVEGDVDKIEPNMIQFILGSNETEVKVEHYSLMRDNNKLILSFNDPAFVNQNYEAAEETLQIKSTELALNETIVYQRPELPIDKELQTELAKALEDQLASAQTTSVFVDKLADSKLSYFKNNASMDADTLMTWFLLQRVYEGIESGDLELETLIESEEHQWTLANVMEMMVVELNNVDVMNALLDTFGGPDQFNVWLNESGYFATYLESRFTRSESGEIKGAKTTVQDVSQLLTHLANETLITADLDKQFIELMRLSPATEKFPVDELTGINARSELITLDGETTNHHYSGIIRTQEAAYVVIILSEGGEGHEVDQEIRSALKQILLTIGEEMTEGSGEAVPAT